MTASAATRAPATATPSAATCTARCLPKNPSLADELIGLALQRRYGERDLAPLDDAFESRAHAAAERLR